MKNHNNHDNLHSPSLKKFIIILTAGVVNCAHILIFATL